MIYHSNESQLTKGEEIIVPIEWLASVHLSYIFSCIMNCEERNMKINIWSAIEIFKFSPDSRDSLWKQYNTSIGDQ